jgi:biotin transporter BioY
VSVFFSWIMIRVMLTDPINFSAGLSGFAIFVSVTGMFLSSFMLFVPVVHEKYDKFARLARAFREVRVGFILTCIGVTFSLLIAWVLQAFRYIFTVTHPTQVYHHHLCMDTAWL